VSKIQVQKTSESLVTTCLEKYPALRSPGIRSGFLFFNFFLVIMAYYQVKPASRSLFIESLSSSRLPYVWIASALAMGLFITWYHGLVERHSRIHVVLGTCLSVSVILLAFRLASNQPGPVQSVLFYVFVDIIGVVLVEQFWSLTNSIYTTPEGRTWFGIVGSGGLVGGVAGGWAAALLIKYTPIKTPDLLLIAAGIILLISVLTWAMGRIGLYCEVERANHRLPPTHGWQILSRSRYLLLIAALLLLAQIASPFVEYQFLNTVERVYTEMDARTAFLSMFFSTMGLVSIGINVVITPLVTRFLGAIAGLLVQPIMMGLCSWGFLLHPTLFFSSATKISDRALSYSINRASKELLYVPVDPVLIYQAKAWIDMFGYRTFKIAGSVLILLMTQWLPVTMSVHELSWFTIVVCSLWVMFVMFLRKEYKVIYQKTQ
jgi:AAA family ATP:ADP antiporter